MILCLLISFFFVPFSTIAYLLFVLGSRVLKAYRNYLCRARRCCEVLGFCTGGEENLVEQEVLLPVSEPDFVQRSSFLSSVGSFLAKSVFASINIFSFFASAVGEFTPGNTLPSQEPILLSPPV
jgi:hypothetical protein